MMISRKKIHSLIKEKKIHTINQSLNHSINHSIIHSIIQSYIQSIQSNHSNLQKPQKSIPPRKRPKKAQKGVPPQNPQKPDFDRFWTILNSTPFSAPNLTSYPGTPSKTLIFTWIHHQKASTSSSFQSNQWNQSNQSLPCFKLGTIIGKTKIHRILHKYTGFHRNTQDSTQNRAQNTGQFGTPQMDPPQIAPRDPRNHVP